GGPSLATLAPVSVDRECPNPLRSAESALGETSSPKVPGSHEGARDLRFEAVVGEHRTEPAPYCASERRRNCQTNPPLDRGWTVRMRGVRSQCRQDDLCD